MASAMRTRLSTIRTQQWQEWAHVTKYSPAALALKCGASPRHLRRFFLQHTGKNPRNWLQELRMRKALRFFADGHNVSETAHLLHYDQISHFSREFKRYYGFTPKVASRLRLRGEAMAA